MRFSLVAASLACGLLLSACGSGTNNKQCMTVGGKSELITDAKLLKLDIYPDTIVCDGADVPPGSVPILSHTFQPGEEIKLDVPPGKRTMVLSTFADDAGTILMGTGCTTTDLSPGAKVCINLTVMQAPDIAVAQDMTSNDIAVCQGSDCPCTVAPNDSCPAGEFCDGTMCQMGCKAASDCVGVGPATDGGMPRSSCNTNNHQCVECAGNNDCPLGKLCSPSGVCTVGCDASHACQGGLSCCNSFCVDTTSDPLNCGSCGNPCNVGNATSCCASSCVDVSSSVDNCGQCGRACSSSGVATRHCSVGKCDSSCSFGNGNCNQPAAPAADNGCETLVNTPSNCGACGTVCDTVAGHASAATCNLPDAGIASCSWSCTGSFRDCQSGAPNTNGCETDTSNDSNNCGACSTICSLSGASSTSCSSSVCTPSCDSSHLNCNVTNDGCEVASSTTNCTGCGVGCGAVPANGSSWSCPMKTCVLACNTNFTVCNGNTCKDLQNDPNNCGACGKVCSTAGTTSTSCVAGVCTPVCDSSHFNCNSNGSNNDGCETATSAGSNCTACGVGCGAVPANGSSWSCSNKTCSLNCNTNFTVCNGNTCKDLNNDATNCGGCGNICDTSTNTGTLCSGGNCGNSSCNANRADCSQTNHNIDECETTATSTAHCGSCSPCLTAPGPAPGFITAASCSTSSTPASCSYTCNCGSGNQACAVHNTGFSPEHWYDCTTPGTFNATEALRACTAHTGDASKCSDFGCTGRANDRVVCDNNGNGTTCNCWEYGTGGSPIAAGKVDTTCLCASASSPISWQ